MTGNQRPETNKKTDLSKGNDQKVLNTALRILTGRDHSKYELIQKLKHRGYKPEDIEKAVTACERFDYINDERTSRVFIEQLTRKGYGVTRILHEMKKKGLRGEQIQNILFETISDVDERENAERILKKNIKRFERESDLKKRRDKIYRFLYARGFSEDTIRKLVNES